MNETLVIVIYAIATFSLTLISLFTFLKYKTNEGYLWLSLLFFSPVIAFTNNILIYEYKGGPILHLISMFFNLSYGGYLILTICFFRNNSKSIYWGWLFVPSYLFIPIIIHYFIHPQYIKEIVSGHDITGIALYINSFYNILIVLYSIGANIWILHKEIQDYKIPQNKITKSRIRKELLTVMLILQLGAFVPYLLQLDAMYVILYMPIFGQLFFVYIFFRLFPNMYSELYDKLLIVEKERYSGIRINKERIEKTAQKIITIMEQDQIYLSDQCSLQSLSRLIQETPNMVSMVINQKFNSSFSEFINKYRIEHSLQLLEESKGKKYSIEGIAFECGFGNRTSFYNAFKKHTGMLPNEYKQLQTQKVKSISQERYS